MDLTSSDPAVEAARRARERAEAEEKRRQNALPEWLQRSTVSGEHTGVGGKQNAVDDTGADEETRKKEEDDCESCCLACFEMRWLTSMLLLRLRAVRLSTSSASSVSRHHVRRRHARRPRRGRRRRSRSRRRRRLSCSCCPRTCASRDERQARARGRTRGRGEAAQERRGGCRGTTGRGGR